MLWLVLWTLWARGPQARAQTENAGSDPAAANAAVENSTVENSTAKNSTAENTATENAANTDTDADAASAAATPQSLRSTLPGAPADAPANATEGAPRPFGLTVVVLLGGVSWEEWAALGAANNSATPGFRRLLEEGALAAARLSGSIAPASAQPEVGLPGAFDNDVNAQGRNQRGAPFGPVAAPAGASPADTSPAVAFSNGSISSAVLRAAATLSAGAAMGTTQAAERHLMPAAYTLSPREKLSAGAPLEEDAFAAEVHARRTGLGPIAGGLLNLGIGAAHSQRFPADGGEGGGDEPVGQAAPGVLGDAAHRAGGRTAALGSADTGLAVGRGAMLREWALTVADSSGIVDTGDVSRELLLRDAKAPFGLRVDRLALLRRFDDAIDDARGPAALVAVEWGDARRAALYAPVCAPAVAEAHRQFALRGADAFLQALMPRLSDRRDRLIVVCVPHLESAGAQWLPLAYWRPQRGGQGALWHARGRSEEPGAIRLEDVTATLAVRLNAAPPAGGHDPARAATLAVPLEEVGAPQSAALRLRRLMALQAGIARLDAARPAAHGLLAVLFITAILFSLPLTYAVPGGSRRGARIASQSGASAAWARVWWRVVMVYPLALWMAGLFVQVMWRSGRFVPGAPAAGAPDWPLIFTLLAVALFVLLTAALVRGWFYGGRLTTGARLRGQRVGVLWLMLTVLGLAAGGFLLPWNSFLGAALPGDALPDGSTSRAGDFWALLLISATMLGVAGLTRVPLRAARRSARRAARRSAQDAEQGSERSIENQSIAGDPAGPFYEQAEPGALHERDRRRRMGDGDDAAPDESLAGQPFMDEPSLHELRASGARADTPSATSLPVIGYPTEAFSTEPSPVEEPEAHLGEALEELPSSHGQTMREDARPHDAPRVVNLRPALLWMLLVVALLFAHSWGRNASAAMVAIAGFGTMWLRLWAERARSRRKAAASMDGAMRSDDAMREENQRPLEAPEVDDLPAAARVRARRHRRVVAGVLALIVLPGIVWIWQNGGAPAVPLALRAWWPDWAASWGLLWWNAALAAALSGAALFLTPARTVLRAHLAQRYSLRAMLTGALAATLPALLLFGPMGPPLIALYTLGAVLYEASGA